MKYKYIFYILVFLTVFPLVIWFTDWAGNSLQAHQDKQRPGTRVGDTSNRLFTVEHDGCEYVVGTSTLHKPTCKYCAAKTRPIASQGDSRD